jgi:dTDP-4-amino-4,6-dideoxygalactose transaminase
MSRAETQVRIPFFDLKAQYASIRDEIRGAIDRVVDSQHFILGPEVDALETEVSAYCGCKFGIGVSSGSDALLVALMAIGINPGDEVITTPYSFFATAGAIARLGARPVFTDIDPSTFNMDPDGIAAKITPRTKAIVPVHLFGQLADMNAITKIANSRGLTVIEDAAQAIGAEVAGRRAGSFGNLSCFSFYPTKNLGGFGDGGMVTTNDPALAERLRVLRSHGARRKYRSELLGGNFRIDAIQAAVLRVKLNHLDAWTEARRRNAALYRELLPSTVAVPIEVPGYRHTYHQFVVRAQRRGALAEHLSARGIGTEVYYPAPLHLQPCFDGLGYKPGDFPASEAAARESLALPIYPELAPDMIQVIADAIKTATV